MFVLLENKNHVNSDQITMISNVSVTGSNIQHTYTVFMIGSEYGVQLYFDSADEAKESHEKLIKALNGEIDNVT